MGVLQANSGRVGVQIAGIKVDDIGQKAKAPFLYGKGQHFADSARFAEGKE